MKTRLRSKKVSVVSSDTQKSKLFSQMSSEDWDLFAIVRSCNKAATFTAPNTNTQTPPNTITNTISPQDTTTPGVEEFTFGQENDSFSFPDLLQPRPSGFLELHQVVMNFISPTTTTATNTSSGNGFNSNPRSAFPNLAGFNGENDMQKGLHHLGPLLKTCTSIGASTVDLNVCQQNQAQEKQQQQQNQLPIHVPHTSPMALTGTQPQVPQTSSLAVPNARSQAPRQRRRKSQEKKLVQHVTPDNITADKWAWRKYGQKSIKGSPHPRNYYRCSSSNACSATKLVERSTTEPGIFILTYFGDHNHEKPPYQNPLSRILHGKPLAAHLPDTSQARPPENVRIRSMSGFSPVSVSYKMNNENYTVNDGEPECHDPNTELKPVPDDNDILIPNLVALSNIIEMGYQSFEGFSKTGWASSE